MKIGKEMYAVLNYQITCTGYEYSLVLILSRGFERSHVLLIINVILTFFFFCIAGIYMMIGLLCGRWVGDEVEWSGVEGLSVL